MKNIVFATIKLIYHYHKTVVMQNPPAQEEHQVTFLAVRYVKTDTAQLLTTEGERTKQEATKNSIPGDQKNEVCYF